MTVVASEREGPLPQLGKDSSPLFDVYPYQNLSVQFPEVGPLVAYGRNVQSAFAWFGPAQWTEVKAITFYPDRPRLQVRVPLVSTAAYPKRSSRETDSTGIDTSATT